MINTHKQLALKKKKKKKKKKKVEWEALTGMCQCLVCAFENSCGCTDRDLPDFEGNDGADRPAGKQQHQKRRPFRKI